MSNSGYWDNGQAKMMIALIDKKEKEPKPVRYYLLLAPTKLNDIQKVQVHSKLYNKVNIGDIIQMEVHSGVFGIRWVSSVSKKDLE